MVDDTDAMSAFLARNWGWVMVRGVLALVFGVLVLLQPGIALFSLILLLAAYWIADGLFAIGSGVRAARRHERWVWFVLQGILGIAAGAIAFLWPGIALLSLVILAAVWAVLSGGMMIAAAFRLRGDHGRWWMAGAGVLSLLWGVLLLWQPVAGVVVLTIWLGAYAIAFGVLLIFTAIRLRSRRGSLPSAPAEA